MLAQLNELMDITSQYTHIVEFWFDGSWENPATDGLYKTSILL